MQDDAHRLRRLPSDMKTDSEGFVPRRNAPRPTSENRGQRFRRRPGKAGGMLARRDRSVQERTKAWKPPQAGSRLALSSNARVSLSMRSRQSSGDLMNHDDEKTNDR